MPYIKIKLIIVLVILFSINQFAQPLVTNAVHYTQVSSFETDYGIYALKMSADGSKIVFATGGPQVKVFTINVNGSGLTQIYDLQTTGFAPFIDITNDGEKILWCDRYGEIFVSNSDGSYIREIASLLPNPDPDRDARDPPAVRLTRADPR